MAQFRSFDHNGLGRPHLLSLVVTFLQQYILPGNYQFTLPLCQCYPLVAMYYLRRFLEIYFTEHGGFITLL